MTSVIAFSSFIEFICAHISGQSRFLTIRRQLIFYSFFLNEGRQVLRMDILFCMLTNFKVKAWYEDYEVCVPRKKLYMGHSALVETEKNIFLSFLLPFHLLFQAGVFVNSFLSFFSTFCHPFNFTQCLPFFLPAVSIFFLGLHFFLF